MRIRLLAGLAIPGILTLFAVSAPAQDTPKDEVSQQVAALREAVIQQTRQIDLLTAEVARMNRVMGGRKVSAEPVVSTPTPPTAPVTPATTVTSTVAAPTPLPTGPEHVVAKGETLTVIAKKHNTTIEVLQKLNNITDARKMQIGQILKLPAETPTPTPSPTN